MVKLTTEVINDSTQHVNACRERELDLRVMLTPQPRENKGKNEGPK